MTTKCREIERHQLQDCSLMPCSGFEIYMYWITYCLNVERQCSKPILYTRFFNHKVYGYSLNREDYHIYNKVVMYCTHNASLPKKVDLLLR